MKYRKDWATVHFFMAGGQCITIQAKGWKVSHREGKPTEFSAEESDRRLFIDMAKVEAIVVDPPQNS
jgi:hypothetical protein